MRGLSGWNGGLGSSFWFVLWPMVYLGKNLIAIRWAAGKLQEELRATAPLAVGEWLSEAGPTNRKVSMTLVEERLP